MGKGGPNFESEIDCKTARILACSSTREQLNKSSETRLKTESETGFFSRACEARELRARKTLTSRFTDFFTDFEKKNRRFCSLGQKRLLNFVLANYLLSFVAKMQRVCQRKI